ncbi:MAG: hypothetical protein IJ167_11650, partial [Lachnospiraceae bacterium]|nr:hypothetical protein [Lachnospiraceae bacterium]
MKTKKIIFFVLISVFAVLTGCSDDKSDKPEIPDINLTEISDNIEADTVTTEEENTGETYHENWFESTEDADEEIPDNNQEIIDAADNGRYEEGEYVTIVNDDGIQTEYFFYGGSGSGTYADNTEDNDMSYTEYQNNLYERQDEIVEGKK